MIEPSQIPELIGSLIWLLAGVGIFIVGMNFLSGGLEKSAGSGMKKLLSRITNNRFSGVGIGAGVTAIVQSSSATSVMVIGLVNAGVMTLFQATSIIMGANIGTTITGILVAFKNDYFNMAMYLLAFAGVMMGFSKKEKVKLIGSLFCGLGLIFVGLNIMSSESAFGNPTIKEMFITVFEHVNFPLLLILIGAIFTALIQSSSAATGVVITMVGTQVLGLGDALFIILGANIGTCVTALLACMGANANAKRVAFIHFMFNVIGTALFSTFIWIFKSQTVNLLENIFPGVDPMTLQMRVSLFHVIFNVSTTLVLLPFIKQIVKFSEIVIKDKEEKEDKLTLKFVDDRLLSTPQVALMQVKKEMDYILELVENNTQTSFLVMDNITNENVKKIHRQEDIINFTNSELTKFLIKLSSNVELSDEEVIGSYFHVLNDLERIGDHAKNFCEIAEEMEQKGIKLSDRALNELRSMREKVLDMFNISKNAFEKLNKKGLKELSKIESQVDDLKRDLTASHFARLAEGVCNVDVSPYYSSIVLGLERIADHLVNVGYSIVNPTGSQKQL